MLTVLNHSEDRFQLLDDRGGYEWTYFDGLSDDGRLGFTAIWFRGMPMSPWYGGALDGKSNVTNPGDYSAFALGIYRDGRRIASVVTEGREELLEHDGTGTSTAFSDNTVVRSVESDMIRYSVHLNDTMVFGLGRVSGKITFSFMKPEFEIPESRSLQESGEHWWVPAAPNGRFHASITVEKIGGRNSLYEFDGHAYHDRNGGRSPLQDCDVDWHWGRFHFDTKAFVFFNIVPRGINRDEDHLQHSFQHAMFFDRGKLIALGRELPIQRITWRNHWSSLPYPTLLTGETESDISFTIEPKELIDSGPFYHRMISQCSLSVNGDQYSGLGMSEYLRPTRLGVGFFRPFVKFRMRRSA